MHDKWNVAFKYSPGGALASRVTVDPAIADGVTIGPYGKDLVIGFSGVTYLPEGFGNTVMMRSTWQQESRPHSALQ